MNLNTDPEFDAYSLNNTNDHYEKMKNDIQNAAINPVVTVWNNYIVDGHKQYKICQELHVPISVQPIHVYSKTDALIWICKNILSEPEYYTTQAIHYFAGKYYLLERSKIGYCGHNQFSSEEILYTDESKNTAKNIGQRISLQCGIAKSTVLKYSRLAKALDEIATISDTILHLFLEEYVIMSYETVVELSKLSRNEIQKAELYLGSIHDPHVSIDDIYRKLHLRSSPIRVKSKSLTKNHYEPPKIKSMPEYDPDSDFSSLIYTIPSWISSIDRVSSTASFEKISPSTKDKLIHQLVLLNTSLSEFTQRLE